MTMTTTTRSEAQILQAIADIAAYTGQPWAEMGAIRDESGISRLDFDVTMARLARAGQVDLTPEENQKVITAGMAYNALYCGGRDNHYAQIA